MKQQLTDSAKLAQLQERMDTAIYELSEQRDHAYGRVLEMKRRWESEQQEVLRLTGKLRLATESAPPNRELTCRNCVRLSSRNQRDKDNAFVTGLAIGAMSWIIIAFLKYLIL